jgi:hypothetical protein
MTILHRNIEIVTTVVTIPERVQMAWMAMQRQGEPDTVHFPISAQASFEHQ